VATSALVTIVDDDESVCRSLERVVGSLGLTVHSYRSAEAFLASADSRDSRCLILDVRLPGMSGLELQRLLTVLNQPIPIVFITAYGSDELRVDAMNAGAIAVLSKPFGDEALIASVSAALEARRI
jgi:FixJ family two-component response regulator